MRLETPGSNGRLVVAASTQPHPKAIRVSPFGQPLSSAIRKKLSIVDATGSDRASCNVTWRSAAILQHRSTGNFPRNELPVLSDALSALNGRTVESAGLKTSNCRPAANHCRTLPSTVRPTGIRQIAVLSKLHRAYFGERTLASANVESLFVKTQNRIRR